MKDNMSYILKIEAREEDYMTIWEMNYETFNCKKIFPEKGEWEVINGLKTGTSKCEYIVLTPDEYFLEMI